MINIGFPLVPGDPATTLRKLLEKANANGVDIRVLIWRHPGYIDLVNEGFIFINSLDRGRMFQDYSTWGPSSLGSALSVLNGLVNAIPPTIHNLLKVIPTWRTIEAATQMPNEGSHHEKIIIVKNGESLYGFCGGIDINPNRFHDMHDVHCELGAHGAWQLLQRFKMRWDANLKFLRTKGDPIPGTNIGLADFKEPGSLKPGEGGSFVKILHTYNNSDGTIRDRSIKNVLEKVIANAKKYIWMEDQYMVSCEIAGWMNKRLQADANFKVKIFTQNDSHAKGDMKIPKRKRKEFLDKLRYKALNPANIEVWQYVKPPKGEFHEELHSKLYIVDSEVVVVGTANCNRRSMYLDSETSAFIFKDKSSKYSFAEHLMDKIANYHPKMKDVGSTLEEYQPDPNVDDLDTELNKIIKAGSFITLPAAPLLSQLLAAVGPPKIREIVDAMWEIIDPNPDNINCKPPTIGDKEDFETAAISNYAFLNNEAAYSPFATENENVSTENYNEEAGWDSYTDPAGDNFFEGEVNYEKAKAANENYSKELRWHSFAVEIYKLFGYEFTDPSDDEFVTAVANWQSSNSMPLTDGKLGPDTWTSVFTAIIRKSSFTHVNIKAAIVANDQLKKILGWEKFEYSVYKVLGFSNVTPDRETFAKAVALWQPKLGFTGKEIDGRLGEKTWAAIRTYVLNEADKVATPAIPSETPVNYPAIIKGTPGIYLYRTPSIGTKQTDKLYPHGQGVTVVALSTDPRENLWRKILTKDNRTGWIQEYHLVNLTLDDVLKQLTKVPPGPYLVQRGDKIDDLVKKFYPDYAITIGNDRRTITHAFSILNHGRGALYFEGSSDTWWRDHVLDRDFEETRRIYSTIRLRENKLIYFPSEAYIKMLRDLKIVGVRPDWKNTAITIGKSIIGFLEGVAIGFKDAAVDTVVGLWDFIKALFTGEIFSQIYDLYKEFEKYTLGEAAGKMWDIIKSIVGEKVEQIKKDFHHPNPYNKFFSIGKLIGYILFEVVVFILTAGTSVAARLASKFGKIQELLKGSKALSRVANAVSADKLRQTVAGFDKAYDLYSYVSAGNAVFTAIDAIKDMGIEGMSLDITRITKEVGETSPQSPAEFPGLDEEVRLVDVWGDEAEGLVKELLHTGSDELKKHGIDVMGDVIPGQHNPSGHGIDMFGFSFKDGKVKIYIIEVKGGKYPKLESRIAGRQMDNGWIEDAIDRALKNKELRAKLTATFKDYLDKSLSPAQIKEHLLKNAERRIFVSKSAMPDAIERILKQLKTIHFRKVKLLKPVHEFISMSETPFTNEDGTFIESFTPADPNLVRRLHGGKGYLLFNVAANSKATSYNVKQVANSGLSLSDIHTALGRNADMLALQDMLASHNKLSPGNPYTIAGNSVDAVFTEAVHQFQIANYLNPADQDGVIGQSTLETLGFNNHSLKSKLNSSGFYGQSQLNRSDVKSQVPVLTNNEFTPANWYQYILKPSWLGVKITDGIHLLLLRKLREAETWLLSQPQYKGMTAAELGRALGFTADTRYSGARLSAEKQAMHGFGLALDINVSGNPWIGAGWVKYDKVLLQERYRMIKALRNASGNQALPGNTVFEYLNSIAQSSGTDTTAAYNTLKQRNVEFIAYLRSNPSELTYWRSSQTFANRNPLNGFLNLNADLVYALRQIAGLAWGAIDFGPNASGDIMHFDLRTIGVGKFLCEKIGGFVPGSGHPAINKEIDSEGIYDEESSDHEFVDQTESHEAIEEVQWEHEAISLYEDNPKQGMYRARGNSVTELAEEVEVQDYEDYYYELDDLTKDWSNAIRQNQYYANKLGWNQFHEDINNLLLPFSGQQNVSLGEEAFAQAVAAWQQQQGFSATESDGIIGPHTWSRMKPLLSTVPQPQPVPTVPGSSTPPSTRNIFDFNKWHAQKILEKMNAGIFGSNFSSKTQLEKIVRGEQVLRINPTGQLIKILPVIHHIGEQAAQENYSEIVIGSFIRDASNGKCTGHCAGRCIDINYKGGGFGTQGATQMVIKILGYLISLPFQYKKSLGFGMPFQGSFFGNRNLAKFKSANPSNLLDPELRQLVTQLGIVFPDNDNHLHIQVSWDLQETEITHEDAESEPHEHFYESESYGQTDEYDISEQEEFIDEIDDLVKDWSNPIRLNRKYASQLGWNQFQDQINDLLLPFSGQQNISLGEEAFAQALANWQQQQGFSAKDADGILGPNTWRRMQPLLAGNTTLSNPTPVINPGPALPLNKQNGQLILVSMLNIQTGRRTK